LTGSDIFHRNSNIKQKNSKRERSVLHLSHLCLS